MKRDQFDQVGRVAQQYGAFAQAFPDQVELPALEIAQTAVDQLGRTAGGALRDRIVLLQHQHRITVSSGRLRHTRTVDTRPDDHYVIVCSHG